MPAWSSERDAAQAAAPLEAGGRGGALFSPNGLELIGEDKVAESYEGRRWQEARAQVQRVLREAGIDDPGFFTGRVLLEIGPGPVGLPEASGAKLAFAPEPLAPRLDAAGESVDVVVARNCLDHVANPEAVTAEVARPQAGRHAHPQRRRGRRADRRRAARVQR